MKVIQKFLTSDGLEFTNRIQAKQHEVMMESYNKLKDVLASSINTGRGDSILKHILLEASEISAILATHRKKLPKHELTEIN